MKISQEDLVSQFIKRADAISLDFQILNWDFWGDDSNKEDEASKDLAKAMKSMKKIHRISLRPFE